MRRAARWLLFALVLTSCDDDLPPRTRPSDPDAGTKPGKPMTSQAVSSLKSALAAATELKKSIDAGQPSRAHYLALRRGVAAMRPYGRMRAQVGSEVLFGPPRSSDEAGGALSLLDRALADGDLEAANKQMVQCVRALRLMDNELMLNEVPADDAVRALSMMAFELGLMLMEAYPGVPDSPEAVLADLHGTLDAIEHGAGAALAITTPALRASSAAERDAVNTAVTSLRDMLDGVKHSHQLTRRAELVQQTGKLGVVLRQLATALGVEVKLPYAARYPIANNTLAEPVTALVVPAPRKDIRAGDTQAIAALGHDLFRDKRLSKGAVRACVDCHHPDKAFSDGVATPSSLDPLTPILRNTPTLLYSPLHGAQLWDGQFASAERQALKVIHTKAEMGLTSDELVEVLSEVPGMKDRFTALFDDGVTAKNIARSLVAYEVRDFVPAQSPIDRFARGQGALSAEQHLGFDVFVGVGRCARCHVPPLFGGSRPTDFATPVYAALGVPNSPDDKRLHADRGRGRVTQQALDENAFKTPTVRNTSLTAPYFHHGGYTTLEQVVDFYEKGGVGIQLKNLDPEIRKIELTDPQRRALLQFMRVALADPV